MDTFVTDPVVAGTDAGTGADRAWLARIPLAIGLAATLAIAIRPANDPDLWWHLATGRYIVGTGAIPREDVFSFTAAGHRWVTHEWLSDLMLYGGFRWLGLNGLALVFAAIITGSVALVYLRCRARPVIAAGSLLLGAAATGMTWGVRPQVFTIMFVALFLHILEGGQGPKGRKLWVLPPLALVWGNLHSGFVAGLAIMAVVTLGELLKWWRNWRPGLPLVSPGVWRLCLVWVACAACSLVTPNGIEAALFPFGTLSSRTIQSHIQEWQSPNFHEHYTWPLLLFWLALLGVATASPRRIGVTRLLLLLGSTVATCYSARHVVFLGLVGAPVLAEQAEALLPAVQPARRTVARPMKAVVALAMAALAVGVGVRARELYLPRSAVAAQYPEAAVAYMEREDVRGRVFNTYHWGGYLIWHGYQVFADGRAEVYGDRVLEQYITVQNLRPGWRSVLADYRVDAVLVETDSPLAVLLSETKDWREAYRDRLATLFLVRGNGE